MVSTEGYAVALVDGFNNITKNNGWLPSSFEKTNLNFETGVAPTGGVFGEEVIPRNQRINDASLALVLMNKEAVIELSYDVYLLSVI